MMETMQTPMNRAEFERRFHLLMEKIRQGKIHFATREMTSGISKVRTLPNGRIDFLSVNESARLQANMTNQFDSESFKAMLDTTVNKDETNNSSEEQS